ncbi:aldehyde dehydrogenase [Arthrobacter sp. KNU40]|uniref:aldehyde dehydrogenase n=1 Tax=Arthrobacter sp. KNU40 TaxID=3447965 RepID=UPI003F609393
MSIETQTISSAEVPAASAETEIAEGRRLADQAAAAFLEWSGRGPKSKRMLLLAAADEIQAMHGDFEMAMRDELGATPAWAGFNVGLASDMLREAASLTTAVQGSTIPSDQAGSLSLTMRVPVGVVLGIAPWNAPVILGVRAVATAIACGNTAILKASELCPKTHALIGEAFARAGFPEGVLNIVTNSPANAAEVVGSLIDHQAVRRINFTGSTAVGRVIAVRAAAQLKPVLLELGGKAPFVVLDDANIDEAVKAAAFGAFMNQGQICMSTERIVVVDSVADKFVAAFAAKALTLVAGDPGSSSAPLGAVATEGGADRVRRLLGDALDKGAELIAGGPGQGVLIPATVLDHVKPTMDVYGEESFGPLVSIVRARDTDDAVRIANDTEFGLSSAVFGRDTAQALGVARRLNAGMCHINGATVHDEAQMPFGGVQSSGHGRFGGEAGIAEFTELRWISIETQPGHFPI